MKKLLILLYPAAWRARYGAELEALMADAPKRNLDVLKGAFAMRLKYLPKWIIAPALIVVCALAGWLSSYGVTEEFRSGAVMTVKPWQSPHDIEELVLGVRARSSLVGLMLDPKLNLYETERRSKPLEEVADTMRKNIRITPFKKQRVFTIEFQYPDAKKAQDTVNALITRMVEETTTIHLPSMSIRLLDRPNLSQRPVYPKRSAFAFTGAVAGFVLAILALLFSRRFKPGPPNMATANI